MASELCKACKVGRNCINGRWCPPRKQYVEHLNIKECNYGRNDRGTENQEA